MTNLGNGSFPSMTIALSNKSVLYFQSISYQTSAGFPTIRTGILPIRMTDYRLPVLGSISAW